MTMLAIGEFARACKLTVKALRHYDQLGLLRPAHVDPSSGYRYYHHEQARDAITIGLLRRIDLPLATIRTILAGDGSAAKVALDAHRERLERDRARAEQAIQVLDHYLDAGAALTAAVEGFEPARRVAAYRLVIPTHDEVPATHQAFRDLTSALDVAGCPITDPALTILHAADGDSLTIDVAVGFSGDAAHLSRPYRLLNLAATATLETVHKGPYEATALAHAALHAWAQEHAHRPTGPLREIYLNDPAHTPAPALLTRVLMPIG